MKKSAIALTAVISLGVIAPVYAEQYPSEQHATEDNFCPKPTPAPTVYVPQPSPTVYVPQPTVTVTSAPITITRNIPEPAPTVYVHTPAHEVIHIVYRTQYVYTDKPQTIIDLAKSQYAFNAAMTAYTKMRAKYLALVKAEKKEKNHG